MTNNNNNLKGNLGEIIGGSAAGVMQVLVGYPFDTVKVRYVQSGSKTISECMKMMIKDNGIKSFYQGVKAPLYGSVFYNTNMFYSYSLFDRYISKKENSIFKNAFICGSLVGLTTTFIESPMDFVKTRMQIDKKVSLSQVVFNTKLGHLYRGFWPTMIRNIPSSGFYFGIYNHVFNYYQKNGNPLIGSLVGGGLAGFACWVSTYPLDNIKTRMQSDNLENPKYKNMMDCIKKTSFRQMWTGFTPCIIRAVPVNAFIFFGYEYAKRIIDFY